MLDAISSFVARIACTTTTTRHDTTRELTSSNSPSYIRPDASLMTSASPSLSPFVSSSSVTTPTTTTRDGMNNNNNNGTLATSGVQGSARKKKLVLGAWRFDELADELLTLSSYDQRKPHSSAPYDKKDRLVRLGGAASSVEIDWETPTILDCKSSGSSTSNDSRSRNSNVNKTNKPNTTIRSSSNGEGVTFAAWSDAAVDDCDRESNHSSGHTRESSTASSTILPSTTPLEVASEEANLTKEEEAHRAFETMSVKHNYHERELDDLESRYRLCALSKVKARSHKYNQDIYQATDQVDREEKQRQIYIDIPYKQACAVLKEHHLHNTEALCRLINEEEIRITNLLKLQETQVITARAEEATRKAAEWKRIADEKAERDRVTKEAAQRQKKQEEEAKRIADENAARQRALEQKQKQLAAPVVPASVAPAVSGGGTNTVAYAEFERRRAKLQDARAAAANAFAENPMQRLQVKKTINLHLNSLAATQEQVKLKTEALMKVLTILSRQPQQFAYGLVLCAEKIVDIAIVRAPMLAFAFSYLAFELSQAVPDFLDLFVAYINERCVLTIPYHPEKKAGQSVADQQRALGYVVSAEGVAETESSFLQRTKAIMNVYAAFMQWPIDRHTHGLGAAWVWIARILNLAPRSATATVLLSFLEIAGFNFLQYYPNQAPKIFALIKNEYVAKLPQSNEERKAARHRVVLWLHEYETKKKLEIPPGMVLPRTQTSDTSIVINPNDDRAQ